MHPLNFVTVVYLVWGAILHKRVNQRKVNSLLKLLWAALQVATQNEILELALFVMVTVCFDHSKLLPTST